MKHCEQTIQKYVYMRERERERERVGIFTCLEVFKGSERSRLYMNVVTIKQLHKQVSSSFVHF